jgi:hypothetical protein
MAFFNIEPLWKRNIISRRERQKASLYRDPLLRSWDFRELLGPLEGTTGSRPLLISCQSGQGRYRLYLSPTGRPGT